MIWDSYQINLLTAVRRGFRQGMVSKRPSQAVTFISYRDKADISK